MADSGYWAEQDLQLKQHANSCCILPSRWPFKKISQFLYNCNANLKISKINNGKPTRELILCDALSKFACNMLEHSTCRTSGTCCPPVNGNCYQLPPKTYGKCRVPAHCSTILGFIEFVCGVHLCCTPLPKVSGPWARKCHRTHCSGVSCPCVSPSPDKAHPFLLLHLLHTYTGWQTWLDPAAGHGGIGIGCGREFLLLLLCCRNCMARKQCLFSSMAASVLQAANFEVIVSNIIILQ